MSSYGLRITGLDVSSSLAAKNSVTMLDNALNRVSDERSRIGSLQNRLDVNISNSETYKMNLERALAQEGDTA
jgi:flagellin